MLLLEEAGVAALSGTAFGTYGEGYLRFSVANSMENLMEALARIDAWVSVHTVAAGGADFCAKENGNGASRCNHRAGAEDIFS